jgi:hypothetical protein
MPAFGLPILVLQRECEYGIALLDGILALGVGGGECSVDGLECLGSRECSCE